ncbi:MAG: hydantoinase/oxoprolinase family protein [Candidatus Jordarchaeaceae archaeon]
MKVPNVLAIDAGGTMTDTIIIDDEGRFTIGKARSTPHDESIGFLASLSNALNYWDMKAEDAVPSLETAIYSGTTMLNRVLERKGRKVGAIVTKGMEHYFRLERAKQTYMGYSYQDRFHAATHIHNEPLIPEELIRGVRERIDVMGDIVIPLYEHEVESAVKELLDLGVEAIVINFLYSYRNGIHESRAKEIAQKILAERKVNIPIITASEFHPIRGDFPRMNVVTLEAYAAEGSRSQLRKIDQELKKLKGRFDLRVMSSHGGAISIETKQLIRSMTSGPIGGIIGGKYLGEVLGIRNIVCTDVGGTSFDVGLITDGEYTIEANPEIGRFLINLPMVATESRGAGMGSYVRVDPISKRVEIGPDSAGYRIGVSFEEGGVEWPTITDCELILGVLNPDYFLGGEIRLNREKAYEEIEKQVASELGLDTYDAAAGIVELLETQMRDIVYGAILGRGYSPVDYVLLSYGGGGPVLAANYTREIPFLDVLVPSWAAAFSAFGCACGNLEARRDRSSDLPIWPNANDEFKSFIGTLVTGFWNSQREECFKELVDAGCEKEKITFHPYARMQYAGQLTDLEFSSPVDKILSGKDMDKVIETFEKHYEKIYARSAKLPEAGYYFTYAIGVGRYPLKKPVLYKEEKKGAKPPEEAFKGERDVYWRGRWSPGEVYEMHLLNAGNVINGTAIVESPNTTLFLPRDCYAYLDEYRIFHIRRK